MHGARIEDEIHPRPRIAHEEIGGKEIAFQAIAAHTGGDEVAGDVRSAFRQRVHVIERRDVELEGGSAIDAAPAAVTHRCALDRPLLRPEVDPLRPMRKVGYAWKGDAVALSTPGQGHLAEKGNTPRRELIPSRGVAPMLEMCRRRREHVRHSRARVEGSERRDRLAVLISLRRVSGASPLVGISMQRTCQTRKREEPAAASGDCLHNHLFLFYDRPPVA
jgi:hypothetical protein